MLSTRFSILTPRYTQEMKNYATQGCLADSLGTVCNAPSQGHEFKALVWHGISLRKKEKEKFPHPQTNT